MSGDPSESFRIGLVQMTCSQDPRENDEKTVLRVREAAARGAQVICLQELFRSQYFCREERAELFDLAESIPGPTTVAMGLLAKELGVVIIASLFERRAAGLYHNTAAILNADGELAGIYRKMHIPDDPLYYEKFYFTPGDLGYRNFDTPFGRLGVLVCWDQWYPEAARLTAMQGADILFYPTAIGWHPAEKDAHGAAQLDAWRTAQRAHAIANGIYVAAVNRTGFEGPSDDGLEFWGNSFVADPLGVMLAEARADREEILVVDCDRQRIEDVRRNWPFFRDRRIESFDGITSRWLREPAGGGGAQAELSAVRQKTGGPLLKTARRIGNAALPE
jgi:N-carbamoylputrescine amidase